MRPISCVSLKKSQTTVVNNLFRAVHKTTKWGLQNNTFGTPRKGFLELWRQKRVMQHSFRNDPIDLSLLEGLILLMSGI